MSCILYSDGSIRLFAVAVCAVKYTISRRTQLPDEGVEEFGPEYFDWYSP